MQPASPDRSLEAELAPACRLAWERTRSFLARSLAVSEQRELSQHLEQCPDCHARYIEAGRTTACLGHMSRTERLARERRARRARQRRLAFEGGNLSPGRKQRAYRLRTLLIPAFFIFLMTQITQLKLPRPAVDLECTSGIVHAADAELRPGQKQGTDLTRGDWCSTAEDSEARLRVGKNALELGPSTWLLVESVRPPRFRLDRGSLALTGRCTLTSAWGWIRVEGAARVELAEGRLWVECSSGSVSLTDAAGTLELLAGESAQRGADAD